EHVQRLPLRNAFQNIDHHDIGQLIVGNPCGDGSAHVARTYYAHFSHEKSPFNFAVWVATARVVSRRGACSPNSFTGPRQIQTANLPWLPLLPDGSYRRRGVHYTATDTACMLSIIAEPNSLVFSFVAPGISRSRS